MRAKVLKGVDGFVLMVLGGVSVSARAISLEDFLKEVVTKHSLARSAELAKEAAQLRPTQGDLTLSPYLTAKAAYYDDQREQLIPMMMGTRTKATDFQIGIAKKFSTGTGISVAYEDQKTIMQGMPLPILRPYLGTLTFGISQSLWKDAFGSATRLRHRREEFTEKLETLAQDLQVRQILLIAEQAYWDLAHQKVEIQIREEALKRARKLLSWSQTRLNSRLTDVADVNQTEALVLSREIQLNQAEDEYKAVQRKVADLLELPVLDEKFSPSDDIASARRVQDLTGGLREDLTGVKSAKENAGSIQSKGTNSNSINGGSANNESIDDGSKGGNRPNNGGYGLLRADAQLTIYDSQMKEAISREIHEGLKPDLVFEGSYAENARNTSFGSSTKDIVTAGKPTLGVALKLSMSLDYGATMRVYRMAKLDADSAKLKAERARIESESAWSELNRRLVEFSARIKSTERLVEVQKKRAQRERVRFENGRTVTFQVVNSEQEAADSELLLYKLKAEQRKLEANGRLWGATTL